MPTIYRKTPKGQAEVETRADRLPPRLRGALILVDGRRSEDDLTKLVPNDAAQVLRSPLDGHARGVAGDAAPVTAAGYGAEDALTRP